MRPHRFAGVVFAIAFATARGSAHATPLDFVPVGDPIEDELRVLDVLGSTDSLPHVGMRPLQVIELPSFAEPSRGAVAIARERVRRALARDRAHPDTVAGASPRLLQRAYADDQRVEASVALEGSGITARGRNPDFTSPSGVHLRFGAQVERWAAHTHLTLGHVDRGLKFAQSIADGNDAVLYSDEAYLTYLAGSGLWSVQMGRSRWQWGPGEEAGMVLSKTSAPLTAFALHLRIRPLRADGMILSATIDPAGGQELAAHRLEWQPSDAVRVGLSEAVRYRSSRLEPLYWVGVLPYALVQSLLYQDQPDSALAVHNNVEAAVDAAWRFAPGQRLYGELLIDDLRTQNAPIVSKFGYLVGWEAATSSPGNGRLTWGAEYARLTRFVYTSSTGGAFVAQDRPLGYPTGPDSRRVHLRTAWDPSASWQVLGSLSRTDAGESDLDHVFHPTDPLVSVTQFLGVVEHTTELEAGLRYWPASGIDLAIGGGMRWRDNVDHVAGARRTEPEGTLRVRIVR